MGFNRFTKDVLNVSALPDRVENQAQQLKATFDQAGADIKEALNDLMTQLEASTSASNIGANVTSVTTKTVQAILTAFEGAIANRYTKAESDALISTNTNNLVAGLDVNLTTGVITVTKKDGTTETFDTALEKVPAKFEIVENNGKYALKVTNLDGTTTQTDVTNLMNIYSFNNSDTINFEVTGEGNEKVVVANIKANSIGLDKLSLTVVSTIEGYMNAAKDSANAAKTSETNARASELNAAGYANTASNKATEAATSANTAATKASEANKSAEEAKKWAEQAGGAAGDLSGYYTKAETDAKIEEAIEGIEIPEGEGGDSVVVVPFAESYAAGTEEYNKIKSCFDENGKYIKNLYIKDDFFSYIIGVSSYIKEESTGNITITFDNAVCIHIGDYKELGSLLIVADLTATGITMTLENTVIQEKLNFDTTPTTGSENPVTSSGVKAYVDSKKQVFTATIPTTGWTTGEQIYVDVTVTGILESDYPHITPVYTNVKATDDAIQEAWNKIKRAAATNNGLRVYAEEIPTTAIPIQIEVVR